MLTVCAFPSLSGSMFQHNCDQRNILKFVLAGHNALITGQAGVGKSVLVKECIKNLNQMRKNVTVVCSSSIACHVYECGAASTIDSPHRFKAAHIPWK